jgi:hypothetical protein
MPISTGMHQILPVKFTEILVKFKKFKNNYYLVKSKKIGKINWKSVKYKVFTQNQ